MPASSAEALIGQRALAVPQAPSKTEAGTRMMI